jgi:hypothetical protein
MSVYISIYIILCTNATYTDMYTNIHEYYVLQRVTEN